MPKFYAVTRGRKTGVFTTWEECKAQVHGIANEYKSFKTMEEALEFAQVSTKTAVGGVNVYCDGACINNGKKQAIAGYGVWFGLGDSRNISARISGEQTNNRAELSAVITALKSTPADSSLTIHTDSKYVIDGIESWIKSWKLKNWMTSTGTSVRNKDLWCQLDNLVSIRGPKLKFEYVKGHSGVLGNEEADRLAKEACKE